MIDDDRTKARNRRRAARIGTAICGGPCSRPASRWRRPAGPTRSCCARQRDGPGWSRMPPTGTSRAAWSCCRRCAWRRCRASRCRWRRSSTPLDPALGAAELARASLRAIGLGYLHFALTETGLFRTIFAVPYDWPATPDPAKAGSTGLNPFQLLGVALDRMVEAGRAADANAAPARSFSPGRPSMASPCWSSKGRCTASPARRPMRWGSVWWIWSRKGFRQGSPRADPADKIAQTRSRRQDWSRGELRRFARQARRRIRLTETMWRARRDSNPRPPDSKSGALSS